MNYIKSYGYNLLLEVPLKIWVVIFGVFWYIALWIKIDTFWADIKVYYQFKEEAEIIYK